MGGLTSEVQSGMRRLMVFLALYLGGRPGSAQPAGPGPQAGPLVRWPEALGFVALTSITFATDRSIRTTMQGHNSGFRNSVADFGNAFGNSRYVFPALFLVAVGAKMGGSSDLYEGSWRSLKSTVLASTTTLVLKSAFGRRRPDVTPHDPYRFNPVSFTFNSFPSGHTTVAFSLATSLAMESKSHLDDVVLYGLAASTAFARVHVDKHWASDTVVGAAIGILAARFVRRHDRSSRPQATLVAWSVTF